MGDDNSTNQSESGTNYTASGHYNNHNKEQINRATVGEGTITVRDNTEQDTSDLNRDTDLAQEVTKDDSQNTNLYASTTAADSLTNLAENPSEQLNQWKGNVTSVGSADVWGQVGENATDALEDTYNAGAAVATNEDLGAGNFWTSLDSTHKMTQLKNDLTGTAEGQALLALLTSDDPDQRLAAEAELGHMAQEKFGIDPSDIHFYQGSETTSVSLRDTVLGDVKGATVTEEGHSKRGTILVNVDNATDGKDMTNTVGHEVYETVTLQTGGENDASQEAIANLVGGQLANRIDQATDGELANMGTGDLAGSNTVRQGTQHANAVGNAQVDYRQLQSKEMQAIKKMAPLMAEKEGITEEAAEKRMAEELLSHLDASWSSNFETQGREGDETALDYLAAALVEQGDAYAEYSDSDVPESPDAAPKSYTKEEVKQSLIAYQDERTSEYNDRTREGEGLTNQYSEQWQFYDKNLAADESLSDYGDAALGAFAGFMDTGGGMVQGWADMISDPAGTAQNMSLGMQQILNEPEGTVSSIFEHREDGQINAALDNLQGDYFSGARTGMSTDLGFALDTGLLPVGRVGSLAVKKKTGNSETITNPSQLLEYKPDPDALVNDTRVSKVVDEDTFMEFYALKDSDGNPNKDSNGNYLINKSAELPAGQYVIFEKDVSGMTNQEVKQTLTIESIPGKKGYEEYDGTNYKIDFDVDDASKLDIPEQSDYLNDIGGPRALGGGRQRVTTEDINVGECNPTCTKLTDKDDD
jgi:filamentous hemagglutinin